MGAPPSKCVKVLETSRLGLDCPGYLQVVLVPPPPGGYFGRKILVIMGLRMVCVCKIFIPNELRLKYCAG